jgi:ubiquinone/menaquinone biosynthesis C-methylase UbiE
MPWWSWWRRSRSAAQPRLTRTRSRPLYVAGRETVQSGDSHYLLPNDLTESHRLDFQHFALHAFFDTNLFAPVTQPTRILDAACGTGRWPVEMAQLFPNAQVIGMDIHEPEQRYTDTLGVIPPNYTFQLGNILEPLPFPTGTFSYTHMRFMVTALPATKWQPVVQELARVTAPGGWVELVEGDLPVDGGPALDQLRIWMFQLVALRGVDGNLGRQVGSFLEQAGLTRVTATKAFLPMGPHGGKVGQLVGLDLSTALRGLAEPLANLNSAPRDQVQQTLAAADEEIYGDKYFCKWPIYIAYGQVPG